MDPVWIAAAFVFGFAVRQIGLPPMVGFLAAGFVLQHFGVEQTEVLSDLADFGVTLLLFSIGLKLKLSNLLRREVWGTATIHMGVTVAVLTLGLLALPFGIFGELDLPRALLIAFALSFSSTVFAIKVLDERSESGSLSGRTAVSILIMQDLFAVVFVTATAGELPSPWVVALVGLFVLRPLLLRIMDRAGHGELLVLLGLLLPIAGGQIFEVVGIKPDLGAIVLGMLLASHAKSEELAQSLLSFKDLFLVCFFLSIGLVGAPSWGSLGAAEFLLLAIPLKCVLFFWLLTRFRLRGRTSLMTSLNLANYSEFGLIVASVGYGQGWIGSEWLIILAISVATSFVLAALLNNLSAATYRRFHDRILAWQKPERIPEEEPVDVGDATIVVFGMGRVGTGAYDRLVARSQKVVGVEQSPDVVARHLAAGRAVVLGDATDEEFWVRLNRDQKVELVLLSMDRRATLSVVKRLSAKAFKGAIAAMARFPDEQAVLEASGIRYVHNFYAEAGIGFADEVWDDLKSKAE